MVATLLTLNLRRLQPDESIFFITQEFFSTFFFLKCVSSLTVEFLVEFLAKSEIVNYRGHEGSSQIFFFCAMAFTDHMSVSK